MIFSLAGRLFGAMILALIIALGGVIHGAAQLAPPEATSAIQTETTVEFPRGMRFAAQIPVSGDVNVERAELLYRIGSDQTLNLAVVPESAITTSDGMVSVELFVDMQTAFVPVGVALEYHWELSAGDSVITTTAEESTMWMDSRFAWQTIRTEQVTLHSYAMSPEFAQQTLDLAQSTLTDLESRYQLDHVRPITIWAYDSQRDFSGSRQVNTREAVAGLSYPEIATTAVIIQDANESELGRVLPHEISHLVLHEATRNPFTTPPLWFDEGVATHYQIGGTDHYQQMVVRAEANGTLFDITSLSASFPFQPAQATLAYASSWSMLAYIEETYGDEGIARLIDAFGTGASSADAISIALDVSPDELNAAWHAWVREQHAPIAVAA